MNLIRYTLVLFALGTATNSFAQEDTVKQPTKKVSYHFRIYAPPKPRHSYVTHGGNGPLLSFGNVKEGGEGIHNVPRFTMFFNLGSNYNYDFSNNFGIFTGLNIKNIGLITKNDTAKLKRRVYTLGVPLGFKIGNIRDGFFVFFGGEYDLAFNYKEKLFYQGDKKKFNEWFSDRTPTFMPSVFAGFRFDPGFGIKLQYYPNNFFNKDFSQTVNGVKTFPYQDLEADMFFVTLSYNFAGGKMAKGHHSTRNKYRGGTKMIIEKETTIIKD